MLEYWVILKRDLVNEGVRLVNDIAAFCELNHGVNFPLTKSEVSVPSRHITVL